MPKWTEQQRDAIADRGHSLIVCAAAGSGKTAVLVERIVQLVREGCPIENMLVVTFTNAAAGEMRQRIGEALGKAAREDPALGEQVMALSRASISTLHRFCGNLLREHFQALSIDPGFRIGDEQECGVLSHQAMEDAIYSCYEVGSDAFLAADRCYTQEELSELAFALHRFMMTRPDPWAFLARAQETVRLTGEAFEQSPAARLLADFAGRRLERLCANARETLALCEGENGPLHYAAACGMDVQLTADLAAAAADAMLPQRRLAGISRAIRKGTVWLLTGALALFTLYLTVSGAAAGSADTVTARLARSAVGVLPVVGSILADAADSVLAGAGAVKNTVGAAGLLAVLAVCLLPLMRLGVQYLVYKAAAFLAGILGAEQLTGLIDALGGAFGLIFGMTGACGLLLLISISSALGVVTG